MTLALIIGTLVMAACLVLLALGRVSAESDRDARREDDDYRMRYVGGSWPCVVCGQPSMYSLNGTPVHPGPCRVTLEARSGKGAAA